MSHINEGAQPFVTFEDVTLKVGGVTLFEGLNWTIRADQQWAIIGPNGAGKSMLAKALCHEVDVVHGRIRYFSILPGRRHAPISIAARSSNFAGGAA